MSIRKRLERFNVFKRMRRLEAQEKRLEENMQLFAEMFTEVLEHFDRRAESLEETNEMIEKIVAPNMRVIDLTLKEGLTVS